MAWTSEVRSTDSANPRELKHVPQLAAIKFYRELITYEIKVLVFCSFCKTYLRRDQSVSRVWSTRHTTLQVMSKTRSDRRWPIVHSSRHGYTYKWRRKRQSPRSERASGYQVGKSRLCHVNKSVSVKSCRETVGLLSIRLSSYEMDRWRLQRHEPHRCLPIFSTRVIWWGHSGVGRGQWLIQDVSDRFVRVCGNKSSLKLKHIH